MKRQPMCVYHIREVLLNHHSKTKKPGVSKPSTTREMLQGSGDSLTSRHNNLTYGEEMPIGDFLRLNSDQIEQHYSVAVDVHEADSLHDGHHLSSDKLLTTSQVEHVHRNVQEYETEGQ